MSRTGLEALINIHTVVRENAAYWLRFSFLTAEKHRVNTRKGHKGSAVFAENFALFAVKSKL